MFSKAYGWSNVYAEFGSNTNLQKHWTKKIGYGLTRREDPKVLFTAFLNI